MKNCCSFIAGCVGLAGLSSSSVARYKLGHYVRARTLCVVLWCAQYSQAGGVVITGNITNNISGIRSKQNQIYTMKVIQMKTKQTLVLS